MNFQQNKLQDVDLDSIFQILLEGMEEGAELDVKRKIVNSILPLHKYALLKRFLSNEEEISPKVRLLSLDIFLDDRTKYFNFGSAVTSENDVQYILSVLSKNCPNIETIDMNELTINNTTHIKTLITILLQARRLKSLKVNCSPIDCAWYALLIDYFFALDYELKDALRKIEYIDTRDLSKSQRARLIIFLPNLKSLGLVQPLFPVISSYKHNDKLIDHLYNITEFMDKCTTIQTLVSLSKFCPKAKTIHLRFPKENVIGNLWRFPSLTQIGVNSLEPDFVNELISVLKKIGKQIEILCIIYPPEIHQLDLNYWHKLCPNLDKLFINNELTSFK